MRSDAFAMVPVESRRRAIRALLRELLAPVRDMMKNPRRALDHPDSALQRMREQTLAVVSALSKDNFAAVIKGMEAMAVEVSRGDFDVRDGWQRELDELATDPLALALLGVVDAAHARHPLSPLVVSPDPIVGGVSSLRALGAIDEATRARGERRARLACAAVGAVVENLYDTYVAKLWVLCQIARGKIDMARVPKFGTALGNIVEWQRGYFGLVDAEAAHLRNAAYHHHWEYNPVGKRVRLWDGAGTWQTEVTTRELIARARELSRTVRSFKSVMNGYLFRELSQLGVMPALHALALRAEGRLTPEHESRLAAGNGLMEAAFGRIPPQLFALHGAGENVGHSMSMAHGQSTPQLLSTPT